MPIKDLEQFNKIKGGYVRYFNLNNELRWGGILIKNKNNDGSYDICNSVSDRFIVSFQKNYVFYKPHQTASNKTRKILSALENMQIMKLINYILI